MTNAEKLTALLMVFTATLGSIWYLTLELQDGNLSAVGWSVLAVVWYVVIRRLVFFWAQGRKRARDEREGGRGEGESAE